MRTIIAGGRDIWDYAALESAIFQIDWPITRVVCGMARGMDSVGWAWAHINGIPIDEYWADWDGKGKAAGILRNIEMAHHADALIVVWDGQSKGSGHMLRVAGAMKLRTFNMIVV
jgi:SLOG family YspA-like protein